MKGREAMSDEYNNIKKSKPGTRSPERRKNTAKSTSSRRPSSTRRSNSQDSGSNERRVNGNPPSGNRMNPNGTSTKTPNSKRRRRKKKKTLFLRIGTTFLFLLVLVLAVGGTLFVKSLNSMNIVDLDNSNLGIADNSQLQKYDEFTKIKNIMLFGVDAEVAGEGGRSDSMMLVTVDPIHDKIKVTSFMRDSCVAIDGYGYEEKLTHAYAYGGPELAIKTINETFGLNIEDFAAVDFATLPKVIDLLGGVEIEISPEELDGVNEVIAGSNYTLKKNTPFLTAPGLQTLSGDQVLAYTRNRSSEGGDYMRTQRQRIVLESLFKKALSTPVTKYPSILNTVMPLITTSMTSKDILTVASNVVSVGNGQLHQARFPLDEYSWGDYGSDEKWYLFFDEESTKEQVQDYIFDDKLPVELDDSAD